jgi:ubiquinone/menaquinone biosynthesis C-methylase UbiE
MNAILKKAIRNTLGLKDSKVGTTNDQARMDWVINSLKEIHAGARVLDAGAGEQKFKPYCQHLNYVSQDFAQYNPEDYELGLQMEKWDYSGLDIVCDIIDIPEQDASFDAIMCIEVIEHIPDPAKVFPEFSRLLKSGGTLIITAPFCSLTHFAPYHYSTGFSKFYYEKHLAENGFEVIELAANGDYFEYLAQELRRLPSVAEKYTNRKPNRFFSIFQNYLLQYLENLSGIKNNSEELLCFGYQVIAKKK